MSTENTVALLGTKGGPAIRPGSTMPTSNMIQLNGKLAVVDCGLGVSRGLIDQGVNLKDIDLIFITHFLLSMKADIDLRIEDEGRPDLKTLVSITDIDAGEVFRSESFTVTAMRNIHPPLTDTFALRFQSPSNAVVFSGDTAYLPALADFAKDADLLIHEAMLEEALGPLMARIGNADDRLPVKLPPQPM